MDSRYPQEPTSTIVPMNSNEPQPQRLLGDSDRATEMADLSLFRSHSMPIPAFAGSVGSDPHAFQSARPTEDRDDDDDDDDEEEEEEDEDLLATPPFVHPAAKSLSSCQRLFSCSLPPSLDRRKTHSSHPQHENALHEFFQLTQPMREGLISREKLLPSSRMKQVGIGGRGRRALSNHKMVQNLFSPTGDFIKTDQEGVHLPSPTKFDQSQYSPGSSSSMLHNNLNSSIGSNSSTIIHSQFAEVPLIRPRPVLAWDHPSRQRVKDETILSSHAESNCPTIK